VGRKGEGRWGREGGKRRARKRGREKGSGGSQGKATRDGSHEWGWEGSDDCGIRVTIEESSVSKSSWHCIS